jgi:hypothetical protein
VRYERTESFKADYRRLSDEDKQRFRQAVRSFNEGCERFVGTQHPSSWPAKLRVKAVHAAPGVWEMTWSFTGPDGRATWEWTVVDDIRGPQPAVRWRRVGDHRILKDP